MIQWTSLIGADLVVRPERAGISIALFDGAASQANYEPDLAQQRSARGERRPESLSQLKVGKLGHLPAIVGPYW